MDFGTFRVRMYAIKKTPCIYIYAHANGFSVKIPPVSVSVPCFVYRSFSNCLALKSETLKIQTFCHLNFRHSTFRLFSFPTESERLRRFFCDFINRSRIMRSRVDLDSLCGKKNQFLFRLCMFVTFAFLFRPLYRVFF